MPQLFQNVWLCRIVLNKKFAIKDIAMIEISPQQLIPGPTGQVRHFAEAKPSVELIRERVLKVCGDFDKITSAKVLFYFISPFQRGLLVPHIRLYGHAEPLNLKFIKDRVILVLNLYDKIDPEKV